MGWTGGYLIPYSTGLTNGTFLADFILAKDNVGSTLCAAGTSISTAVN